MPELSLPPTLPHLYAEQRRRALAIARRVLRDGDAAEDVVQELFTRLVARPHLVGPEATAPGWLRRVVVNACINWLRSQERRRRLTLEPTPAVCPERQALGSELQARFEAAGVEVLDAKLTHLAYAAEIAQVMLRRQQAEAIISARAKIVHGAVSMVEAAPRGLSERGIVELDDERKATMVSNLLVVLCSDKETQPIVNTGTLYN